MTSRIATIGRKVTGWLAADHNRYRNCRQDRYSPARVRGARDPSARHVTRGSSVHRLYAIHERGLCTPKVSATTQRTL
jgi:hypothetical protein